MAEIEQSIVDSLINAHIEQNPDVNVINQDVISGLIQNFQENKQPLGDIERRAKALFNYKPVTIDDAPSELKGRGRVDWAKNNMIDPFTGQSLSEYMENQGLGDSFGEYYDANRQFKNNIKDYNSLLRDDIRSFSGTKLDLVRLSHNNEAIRNFLGVSEEETLDWLNRFSDLKESFSGMRQSLFAQSTSENIIYEESGMKRNFHEFLNKMGYGEYMQMNNRSDEKWELGL